MVSSLHCWNNSIWTALGTVEPPSSATRGAACVVKAEEAASLGILSNCCRLVIILWTRLGTWEALCPYWWRGYHPGTPPKRARVYLRIWASCKTSKPRILLLKFCLILKDPNWMYAVLAFLPPTFCLSYYCCRALRLFVAVLLNFPMLGV